MKILRLLLIALLPLLPACDDGGTSGSGGALDGTAWRLDGWSASSLHPADFTITASFSDGIVGGTSAVNHYSGPFTAKGGVFFAGPLAVTEMAGPEPAMRAEQIYLNLLGAARKYDLTAENLLLRDAGGNELLRFVPAK
ncbi:MAG: META domain-containing protein [Kiritimatiellia bacterium]